MTHPTDPVAAMREALKFYASMSSWTLTPREGTARTMHLSDAEIDMGKRARDALALPLPAAPARGAVLRRYLWLTHGHDGLYGDDGEMQCQRCPADYRRDPLPDLVTKADRAKHAHGLAQLAKHAAERAQRDAGANGDQRAQDAQGGDRG